jgi:hypothetical protein
MEPNFLNERCDVFMNESEIKIKETLHHKCHFMTNPIQLQVDK